MARKARIEITGDAASFMRAVGQASASVAAFQKQLGASGVAASATAFAPAEMQKALKNYEAQMKASNERLIQQNKQAQEAIVANTADAAKKATVVQAQSLKEQRALYESHMREVGAAVGGFKVSGGSLRPGMGFLAGTLEEAQQLTEKLGQGATFAPLTKSMKDFVVESQTGERMLIQNRKVADELARNIGVSARQLSFGANNLTSTMKDLGSASTEVQRTLATGATRSIHGYEQLGVAASGAARRIDEVAKAQEGHNIQLGRGVRATLAGAGAFSQLGRSIAYASATFLSFAVLSGVFRGAVEASANFELSLAHIVGLAGGAREQVEKFGQAILRLAPSVGQSPRNLADALYFIASAGIKVNKQMAVLRNSALAASSGLGEVNVVADAVTSAMNAYGQGNISAAAATNVLVDTVHYGKGEAATFAPVLGTVASFAAGLGIKFKEVGAALAEMTRLGKPARTAGIELQAFMTDLLSPTELARKNLLRLGAQAGFSGLSFESLVTRLHGPNGLISVLKILNTVLGGNAEKIRQVFTNVRAVRGVLALVGKNAADTFYVFRKMAGSTNAVKIAFGAISKDPAFRFEAFKATLQSIQIMIGNILLPYVLAVGDAIGKWIGKKKNIDELNSSIRNITGSVAELVKVVKTFVQLLFPLMHVMLQLTGGFGGFVKAALLGWGLMRLRSRAMAAEIAKEQMGAASSTMLAWRGALSKISDSFATAKKEIRGLTPIASARQAFVNREADAARRADLAARSVPVTILRQPRGARGAGLRGPRGFLRPEDILRPGGRGAQPFVMASRLGVPGGGQLIPIRFVTEPGPLRNTLNSIKSVGTALSDLNQRSMQFQRRVGRATGTSGLMGLVFGQPTQVRDQLGRGTTQLVRDRQAAFDRLEARFSQMANRFKYRMGRINRAINNYVVPGYDTQPKEMEFMPRPSMRGIRQELESFNQATMQMQRRIVRNVPGGSILNAVFGTPTQTRNALGQGTAILERQGNLWRSLGSTISSAGRSVNNFFASLERNQRAFRAPLRALIGTPVRQQDPLTGQFTTQVTRQGGAPQAFATAWTSAIARVSSAFKSLRGLGGTSSMQPQIDPGPIRRSLKTIADSMKSTMAGVARATGVAFDGMFAGVKVAAASAATTTRAVFTIAIVSIGAVAKSVLAATGWGLIAIAAGQAAVEIMNHWRDIKDFLLKMWQVVRTSAETAWRAIVGAAKIAAGGIMTWVLAPIRLLLEALARLPLVGGKFKGALDQIKSMTTGMVSSGLHDISTAATNWGVQAGKNFGAGFQKSLKMLPPGMVPGTHGMAPSTRQNPGGYLTAMGLLAQGLNPNTYATAPSTVRNPGGFSRVSGILQRFGFGFVPGTGDQFALPSSLGVQQASVAAFGNTQAQEKFNATLKAYLRALLQVKGLTDQQRIPILNMIASLRKQKTNTTIAINTQLQLNEAQAELAGSSDEIVKTQSAIRDWIIKTMSASKHSKEWMVSAVQALKSAEDAIVTAMTELPPSVQLQAAVASTTKTTVDDIAAVHAAMSAINKQIVKVKNDPKLSKAEKTQALIALNNALGQQTSQLQAAAKKQFQIPMKLQIEEAKAAAEGTVKQQKAINTRIVAWIRTQIASGKLHGDALVSAYQELSNRITKSVQDHASAVKQATDAISQAIDTARSTIGDLFNGPILNPTELQQQMTLGLQAPSVNMMTRDINAQTRMANRFFNDLAQLRKRGAPQQLIDELMKQGVSALPNADALVRASNAKAGTPSAKAWQQFLKAFAGREKLAVKAAVVDLKTNHVNLIARQIVSGMTPRQIRQLNDTGRLPLTVEVTINGVKQGANVKTSVKQRRGGAKRHTVPSSIGAWANG